MITRKVEHYEFKEVSRRTFCNYSMLLSDVDTTEIKDELGNVRYIQNLYNYYVDEKTFEIGGFYAGNINGKFLECHIYY